MILDSESGSARRGVGNPLLLENALYGQVVTMRRRASTKLDAEARGLLQLQSRFVAHYFRLQTAERKLSNRMQSTRPAAGRFPRARPRVRRTISWRQCGSCGVKLVSGKSRTLRTRL